MNLLKNNNLSIRIGLYFLLIIGNIMAVCDPIHFSFNYTTVNSIKFIFYPVSMFIIIFIILYHFFLIYVFLLIPFWGFCIALTQMIKFKRINALFTIGLVLNLLLFSLYLLFIIEVKIN